MTRVERFLVKRIQRATLRKHDVIPPRQKKSRNRAQWSLLPAEKANLKRKRIERKAAVDAAITEGHEAIWNIAVRLTDKYPDRSAEEWYCELFSAPMKKLNERRVNRWNAFLRGETKKRNAGKF